MDELAMTESDLVSQVRSCLAERGIETFGEVPSLAYNIDFVHLNPLTAVEAKLRDWHGGLIQARRHLVAVDYSYVLLPKRKVTARMCELFDHHNGIGLYLWDGSLIEAIKPRRNTEFFEHYRKRLLETLEEVRKIENR